MVVIINNLLNKKDEKSETFEDENWHRTCSEVVQNLKQFRRFSKFLSSLFFEVFEDFVSYFGTPRAFLVPIPPICTPKDAPGKGRFWGQSEIIEFRPFVC